LIRATTTIKVLRSLTTSYNEYGDEVENLVVISSRVPAAITEQRKTYYNPTEGQLRTLRNVAGRVNSGTDILSGDILIDERTGNRYAVEATDQPQSPVMQNDLTLELVRQT
jgi:hypothetical protein